MNKPSIYPKNVVNAFCILINTISLLYLMILSIQYLTITGIFSEAFLNHNSHWIVSCALILSLIAFISLILFSIIVTILNYKKTIAWIYGISCILLDFIFYFGFLDTRFIF